MISLSKILIYIIENVVTYVLTQQGAYQSCYITAFGSGVVVYSYHDKHNVYDKWQSRKL